MTDVLSTVVLFLASSGVILAAGVQLSRYGDVIAERTGLALLWRLG